MPPPSMTVPRPSAPTLVSAPDGAPNAAEARALPSATSVVKYRALSMRASATSVPRESTTAQVRPMPISTAAASATARASFASASDGPTMPCAPAAPAIRPKHRPAPRPTTYRMPLFISAPPTTGDDRTAANVRSVRDGSMLCKTVTSATRRQLLEGVPNCNSFSLWWTAETRRSGFSNAKASRYSDYSGHRQTATKSGWVEAGLVAFSTVTSSSSSTRL